MYPPMGHMLERLSLGNLGILSIQDYNNKSTTTSVLTVNATPGVEFRTQFSPQTLRPNLRTVRF